MIGTTVSHYRVLASVGVGGMGIVYLAEDTRLNRKVALKVLPPATAQDLHARARFLREAQAASTLDHPNVATIYEIGDWEQQLFIAVAAGRAGVSENGRSVNPPHPANASYPASQGR